MSSDFQLLSSIRYDSSLRDLAWNTAANDGAPSSYLLLRYHYDRLRDAAQEHGWAAAQDVTYNNLARACDEAVRIAFRDNSLNDTPLKLRILLNHTGMFAVSASPAASLNGPDPTSISLITLNGDGAILEDAASTILGSLLTIHLDTSPTPSSLFTRTKTTHRPQYTAARTRMGIPPLPTPTNEDVLMYTPSGELTETSIRNIAFLRHTPPQWVTPRASIGCLSGVMRRWLLEQGRIVEASEGELTKDEVVDGEYVMTFNGVEGCRLGRVTLASC
ncbi:uncharacterized protein LAESUDRAFT_696833 [Laetiporus sulphureus 93-53]|uniref:D-aminoacid aminotransferase-like PLP-dependent enzyme n=1 Tax=Laetiporus sulphureus 93-53 TaxID=1314785 RepID=A0A165FA00_9APHY|nr:uncharacterized protein LAESUDRAFT_696833 [Laetiporus sulphureus 93-53]KZT08656.1 hypothetical protein LAESUDRAFT_696833 [Laetiporus sulphureus 93-53]